MEKTRAEKKRKGSDSDDGVATVKAEANDGSTAPVLVSPIQKILGVDLLKDDSNTVQSALAQLANLCWSNTVLAPPDLSSLSPIQKILGVDLLADDSNTVQSALAQLANLCWSNTEDFSENRATVHRLGGATIVTGIMRKWYGFPVIQAEGCRALQNASVKSAALSKKSVKDSGGLDAIIWAMESYPDNLQVQTNGCGALRNVVLGVKENAEHVVNTLNGVDWIIAAMNKFPHDAKLQKYACVALDNLTEWDEFKDPVKQAGGRRALFDAIENHKDESKEYVEKIQEKATSALKKVLP